MLAVAGTTIASVTRLYLQGALVTGARRGMVTLDDPSTGETLGKIHTAGPTQLRTAAIAARAAVHEGRWPRMPRSYRVGLLRTMLAWIESSSERLTHREVAETGIPSRNATWQLTAALDTATAMLETDGGFRPRVHAFTGGLVGDLPAWITTTIAALRDGGAVILAPAPRFRSFAALLGEAAEAAGAMPGVLQSVPTADATELMTSPMLDDAWILAPQGPIPVQSRTTLHRLDPTLALAIGADADVGRVAEDLAQGFTARHDPRRHARIALAHADLVDAISDAVTAAAITARLGSAHDPLTEVGPITDRDSLDMAISGLAAASQANGTLACGGVVVSGEGVPEGGRYLAPTVLVDAWSRAPLPGPVIIVIPADSQRSSLGMIDEIHPARVRVYGQLDPAEVAIAAAGAPIEVV